MSDKRDEEKEERQRKMTKRAASLSRERQEGEVRVVKWPIL